MKMSPKFTPVSCVFSKFHVFILEIAVQIYALVVMFLEFLVKKSPTPKFTPVSCVFSCFYSPTTPGFYRPSYWDFWSFLVHRSGLSKIYVSGKSEIYVFVIFSKNGMIHRRKSALFQKQLFL